MSEPSDRFASLYEAPGDLVVAAPKLARKMVIEWFDDAVRSALAEPENPLIADFLDEEALSVFYGDSNAGKTFVALDAAFAVATGQLWNGRHVKHGLAVYIAAEGGKKIRRRLAALAKQYEELCGDIAPKPFFALIRYPIDLRSSDADLQELLGKIREAEKATGEPCVWVTVDTLSRAMAGGDENSPIDMGKIVCAADRIRSETKAHFSYVHHTGKDTARGARGHSLLRAATNTEIEVTPTLVTVTKQRDAEGGLKLGFSLVDMVIGTDASGAAIKSAVVSWKEAKPEKAEKSENPKSIPPCMRMLMDVVASAIEEAGQSIRPFHDGPVVIAAPERAVRARFDARVAERAEADEDRKKLADRKRTNFRNAIKTAIDREALMAGEWNGERWIWRS